MERRIALLESSLGLDDSSGDRPNPRDLHSRINAVLSGAGSSSCGGGGGGKPTRPSAETLYREMEACDRLVRDLDPGSVLTHQSTVVASSSSASAAPLLFRRQEVLASHDQLGRDLDQLGRLRDLLLLVSSSSLRGFEKGTVTVDEGKKSSSAAPGDGGDAGQRFIDAPILSSEAYVYASDLDAVRRLRSVSLRAADLRGRSEVAASRVDDLLVRYRGVMAAVSEKLVMADEKLATDGR